MHSLFPFSFNRMGQLTDTTEERLGAGPIALPAVRGTGMQTPTFKLRGAIKYFYNPKKSITISARPGFRSRDLSIGSRIRQLLD